jgi:hypothetical protein
LADVDLFLKLARFAPPHVAAISFVWFGDCAFARFSRALAGIDSRSFLLSALQPFFGFADAALLSAFLELKKLTVTRGRLCFLQSIRSLPYYEIRVQSDCGPL